MTLAARLYRTVRRIVPCDVTVILALDARRLPRAPAHGASASASPTLHLLDEAEVRARASDGSTGFDAALPVVRAGDGGRCAVALHDGELVAHAWFAGGTVPAALNSGGERFAGIGLRLPTTAVYLYKVQVAPAWRGRGLARLLIAHGARALRTADPRVDHVVTTTDFTNAAFRRSTARLGFERRDRAAEIVLGGRFFHRVPPPLPLPDGQRVTFFPGAPPPRRRGG